MKSETPSKPKELPGAEVAKAVVKGSVLSFDTNLEDG
jgi:hypothetical protein